jgi:hypothetical protein
MVFLDGVVGQPWLQLLREERALSPQIEVIARRDLFSQEAIPLVGVRDHLVFVGLDPVRPEPVVAMQLAVLLRKAPTPHQKSHKALPLDEEVERHVALPDQHELARPLDLPRHVRRCREAFGLGDGHADHHGWLEVLKVAAAEIPIPHLARCLLERLSLVERRGGVPHVEEAAERLPFHRDRQICPRTQTERRHRLPGGWPGGGAVAQPQGLPQRPDLVHEFRARGIGFPGRARRRCLFRMDELVQSLAHDLGDDQPDRLGVKVRDRALRHDLMLDPFHRGEENGCPLHRLGQDLRAQRNGEARRRPSVGNFFWEAAAELPGAVPAPEVGDAARAAERPDLRRVRRGPMCDTVCDAMCDSRPDPAGPRVQNCFRYVFSKTWLGRQDSNLGSRDQNPLPYRLATPQRPRFLLWGECAHNIVAGIRPRAGTSRSRRRHGARARGPTWRRAGSCWGRPRGPGRGRDGSR